MKTIFTKKKIPELILCTILFVLATCNLIFTLLHVEEEVENIYVLLNGILFFVTTFFILLQILIRNRIFSYFCLGNLLIYFSFILLVNTHIITLPTQKLLPDFTHQSIQEVLSWGKENQITIEQISEYNDSVMENYVFSQNIKANSFLKNIDKLTVTVSSGPNYDKMVIIPSLIGYSVDEAIKVLEDLLLNNIKIVYIEDDSTEKDLILTQSIKGQIRRNEELILEVSLGKKEDLVPISMIDLSNKTLFEANLWLSRNGITYTIQYEFSDQIKRGNVISASIKEGMIDPNKDQIKLIVSKGKKIIVPNLKEMTLEEVTNWVISNHLKITYEDRYDEKIALGKIIEVNQVEGTEIEEDTLIRVVTSKGPLRMEAFSNINDFRTWADKYSISYQEEYEFNQDIAKGNIIRFSHTEGQTITNTDVIKVYISQGSPVTVPNFVGKSKSEISASCKKIGLNCSFQEGSYSTSVAKGIATSQNKKANSTVVSGTYITITLSKGKPESFTVYIQPTWLGSTADATINTLKTKLSSACPGVNFQFVKKASNTGSSGMIHPESSIKGGNNTFTQGKTYTITIINN